MINQEWMTLIGVALGSVLTMLGGIVASYVTQRLTNRKERNTFVREKCEELYLLLEQIKRWAENEHDRWLQEYFEEFEPDNELLAWYSKKHQPMKCPIDRLMMITALHLPDLKSSAGKLNTVIKTYQGYTSMFPEFQWDVFNGDIRAVLKSEREKLDESHQELKEQIEKTILASWGINIRKVNIWRKNNMMNK